MFSSYFNHKFYLNMYKMHFLYKIDINNGATADCK